MNEIEITFNPQGNTICGNYSLYRELESCMNAKRVFTPFGYMLKAASERDLRRLIEYVGLFGHCIKTLKAYAKACDLAGVELEPNVCDLKPVNDSGKDCLKEQVWSPV